MILQKFPIFFFMVQKCKKGIFNSFQIICVVGLSKIYKRKEDLKKITMVKKKTKVYFDLKNIYIRRPVFKINNI